MLAFSDLFRSNFSLFTTVHSDGYIVAIESNLIHICHVHVEQSYVLPGEFQSILVFSAVVRERPHISL
jgi:hypothetical protein